MRRAIWFCAALAAGCFPSFEDDPTRVAVPRVLAVRCDPPEAAPGESFSISTLVAGPNGTVAEPVTLALCLRPRVPAERNGVAAECLGDGEVLVLTSSRAQVPGEACARFGPTPPPPDPGQPPLRPADPDPSGGYYLPVRAGVAGAAPAFGSERLRCPLAGAPREIFREFQSRYADNTNPQLEELEVPGVVGRGEEVQLRARWSEGSAEHFPVYDQTEVELEDRVEALSVAWFATTGTFLRAKSEGENIWVAPSQPTTAYLWAVLRDSRGGIAWTTAQVIVE